MNASNPFTFRLVLAVMCAVLSGCEEFLRPDCEAVRDYQTTQNWAVKSTGWIYAELIWQQTVPGDDMTYPTGQPNAGLAIAENQVALVLECDGRSALVAFDIASGEKRWEIKNNPSHSPGFSIGTNLRSLIAISDGFVLVSIDSLVTRINAQGEVVWWNRDLPSRSINAVYQINDFLYFPSYSIVYELSLRTGVWSDTIELDKPVWIADTLAFMFNVADRAFDVMQWPEQEMLFQIPTNRTSTDRLVSDRYPLFQVSEGYVLVYDQAYDPNNVRVFDRHSGNLIWEQNISFSGFPIVLGSKLIGVSQGHVEIYSLANGEYVGAIELRRDGYDIATSPNNSIWLAGANDKLAIYSRQTHELVVLRLLPMSIQ